MRLISPPEELRHAKDHIGKRRRHDGAEQGTHGHGPFSSSRREVRADADAVESHQRTEVDEDRGLLRSDQAPEQDDMQNHQQVGTIPARYIVMGCNSLPESRRESSGVGYVFSTGSGPGML